jgi:hypothetical protein
MSGVSHLFLDALHHFRVLRQQVQRPRQHWTQQQQQKQQKQRHSGFDVSN